MDVQVIKDKEALKDTFPFEIRQLLWGTERIARTYGYIGFVQDKGFCLKMVCEEKNPLRVYKNDQDPVYKDSAMEAFFRFEGKDKKVQNVYLNFEMNANGALLACYGESRNNRIPFEPEEIKQMNCKAQIEETGWSVELWLPVEILKSVYGELELKEGSVFYCNFYKICESKEAEHYASYNYVESERPNFHLPEYFAKAVIVAGNKKKL